MKVTALKNLANQYSVSHLLFKKYLLDVGLKIITIKDADYVNTNEYENSEISFTEWIIIYAREFEINSFKFDNQLVAKIASGDLIFDKATLLFIRYYREENISYLAEKFFSASRALFHFLNNPSTIKHNVFDYLCQIRNYLLSKEDITNDFISRLNYHKKRYSIHDVEMYTDLIFKNNSINGNKISFDCLETISSVLSRCKITKYQTLKLNNNPKDEIQFNLVNHYEVETYNLSSTNFGVIHPVIPNLGLFKSNILHDYCGDKLINLLRLKQNLKPDRDINEEEMENQFIPPVRDVFDYESAIMRSLMNGTAEGYGF